jgi:hypothetical protein
MKLILITIVILFCSIKTVYSQRIIKSAVIRLDIKAKANNTDSLSNQIISENSFVSEIDYSELIDSLQLSQNIEIDSKIDTVLVDDERKLEIKLNFDLDGKYKIDSMDFSPGKYLLTSSSTSKWFIEEIKNTLENDILNWIDSADILIIKIKGSADAIKIKKIKYRNEYGKDIICKCLIENKAGEIKINGKENITDNYQLAFLRTYGVRDYLENKVSGFKNINHKFEHYIEISKNVGSNYRTVGVEMVILKQLK